MRLAQGLSGMLAHGAAEESSFLRVSLPDFKLWFCRSRMPLWVDCGIRFVFSRLGMEVGVLCVS